MHTSDLWKGLPCVALFLALGCSSGKQRVREVVTTQDPRAGDPLR
jgi:hypothetical protein